MAKNKKSGKKTRVISMDRAYDGLRNRLMKPKSVKMLDRVDDVINKVSDSITNKDTLNKSELLKNVFSDAISDADFRSVTPESLFTPELMNRLGRYSNSSEIIDMLPYCARALKVLTDEIISPDDITKEVLTFLTTENLAEADKESLNRAKQINSTLQIEDSLYNVIHDLLGYGDQFIELCDYTSKDVPITQSLLNESDNESDNESLDQSEFISKEYEFSYEYNLAEGRSVTTETKSFKVSTNIIVEANDTDKETRDLNDIRLLIHDPKIVIKLQSTRFRMCLGYLILPDPNREGLLGVGPTNAFKSQYFGSAYGNQLQGIDRIYNDLMGTVKKYLGRGKVGDIKVNEKEVKDMLSRAIAEYEDSLKKPFQIRYVPPDRMEHFIVGTRRFFPYGESIFYKSTFAAKLLIAMETAITVKRISDSSEKRVMYIETTLPRTVRNLIDDVKESLKKRKYSIGSLGNIASIPSSITTFEDIYIPQKQGKKWVEFDTIPPAVNIRELHEELKFFRDQLVSALEVPPAFLNLEENLSNKAALGQESILFARTIIAYQKVISKFIIGLFKKIYKFVHGVPMSKSVNIQLPKPKMLQNEREAEQLDTIGRIISVLIEQGIPKEYLHKKYLSLDWDEIEKFKTDEKLDKETSGGQEEDLGAMGGGY